MTTDELIFDVGAEDFQARVVDQSNSTPVLVDFWADWCAPCKSLMPVLRKLVEAYGGAFLLAKVNADEQQALVQQVGVRSLPTVLLVKDGQVVDHFQGALPEGQVRAFLDRHVQPAAAGPAEQAAEAVNRGDHAQARSILEEALRAQPGDTALMIDLAMVLAAQGDLDAARQVVDGIPNDVEDERLSSLRARLTFASRAGEAEPAADLEARLEVDPLDSDAAYKLAIQAVAAGDYDRALDMLMDLARRDRSYGEDAARRTLLELFDVLGADDPRVKDYRRRLFTLLY